MADNFNLELVSPERLLLSEKVIEVVIPATEGEMTVMGNHAPVMTTLKPGVVRVKDVAGKTTSYVVFGGFADVTPESCTLLAESAMSMEELDREKLKKRIDAANAELEAALNYEHRTQVENYLAELTRLNGIVMPA